MLTCIARSKQPTTEDHPQNHTNGGNPNKSTTKSLSFQIKDMALKASGAYRHCAPCAAEPSSEQKRRNGSLSGGGGGSEVDSVAPSEKFRWSHRRTGSSSSGSTAGRKELEARLKVISSGERTPAISASGRRVETVVFVEESEPKEWVAQIEPGVLITFVSLPRGGNDLKRIRFSREMFNKYQAQKWWAENCERVMELHNVKKLNRQAFPLPTTPRSEDNSSSSKIDFTEESPTSTTPPLNQEPILRTLYQPNSSSDSRSNCDSSGVASTPKLSSISGSKMETSSMDTSIRTSTSNDASNVSDMENEWVEQDEPGVYITIRALPDGKRELRRVRFSREKFGEMHAKVWWEENRARVHKLYL